MYICYGTSTVLSVLLVAMWPCQLEEERAAYRSELYRQARSKRVEAQMEREQGLQKEKEVRQLCAGGGVGEMCLLVPGGGGVGGRANVYVQVSVQSDAYSVRVLLHYCSTWMSSTASGAVQGEGLQSRVHRVDKPI